MAESHLSEPLPAKHFTYLVVMPDVPNGTRTNLELRAKHVENSKVGYANGRIIEGSAWYGVDPAHLDREPTLEDMRGSFQIVRGASAEAVRETFSKDPYVIGGAWDISKVQIYPIMNRPLNN